MHPDEHVPREIPAPSSLPFLPVSTLFGSNRNILCVASVLAVALAPACTAPSDSPVVKDSNPNISAGLAAITAEGILRHTEALSADSMEGRGPGTPGEDKAIAYLTSQFRQMGLTSGNPDGSFVQNVELIGFTSKPTGSFKVKGKTIPLRFPDDFVANSRHDKPVIDVNSELVFVGYGVVAPEYGWDYYKNVDVKGKTIVMLINDPAVASASDSGTLDSAMFKGKAMTYYGRWTYKYEIASAKGAAGAIIIHETEPAGYPYEVVTGSWSREQFDVVSPDSNSNRVQVESWITSEKAEELFRAAGHDLGALKAAARTKDFRPVSLGATASFHVENSTRRVQSRNVVATLGGSDSTLRNEYVIYTAHWDHLGRDTTATGDQIYNGALDNASGTAALLQIASAYTKLTPRPKRSVMFLAVTAEEKGLLGAKYFAENPLVPLDRVLANINMDGVNQWGKTSDLVVVGYGNSTLDDVLAEVVRPANRTLAPDPEPEKGFFYRSDHFEFAKKGVPALYVDAGVQFIGKPADYGKTKREEYTARDYHKPSDEVKSDWDLSGAVEDTRALFEVGLRVLNGDRWPEWKPGTEFKALRDSVLRSSR